MFSTILIPLDASETAAQALPAAQEMARRFSAKVVLLHVLDTTNASLALGVNAAAGAITDPNAITNRLAAATEAARAYLTATGEMLATNGLSVTTEVRDGPAGATIVATAQEMGAELIVMSSHGRSGLSRLVFGSVTNHVVRHATTPVLVVRAEERPARDRE